MKKIAVIIFFAALALPTVLLPVRAECAPSNEPGTRFTEAEGKEWVLIEVNNAGTIISIDRQKLEADSMGGFFTISFQNDQANGVGAPNRYFGPYRAENNLTISIGKLASTMMAAFREPEALKESEFLAYISNSFRWNLRGGRLELYSTDGNGAEIILTFVLK